jgi:hypothetical protein
MTAQRRTALFSVIAAVGLIALKLATGLATHSLGLLSEAAHTGRRSISPRSPRVRSSSLRAASSSGARSSG